MPHAAVIYAKDSPGTFRTLIVSDPKDIVLNLRPEDGVVHESPDHPVFSDPDGWTVDNGILKAKQDRPTPRLRPGMVSLLQRIDNLEKDLDKRLKKD